MYWSVRHPANVHWAVQALHARTADDGHLQRTLRWLDRRWIRNYPKRATRSERGHLFLFHCHSGAGQVLYVRFAARA